MDDDVLGELVRSIERKGSACPVTLMLSSAIQCGIVVDRSTFLTAIEELAVETNRPLLKEIARAVAEREEEPGSFIHLIKAVVISGGQGLELAVTSEDGRSVFPRRTPARVRLRDVQSWHFGSPFEVAAER